MSKKLIIIIISLFIIQFGFFTFIERKIKPEEAIQKKVDDFQDTYGIFLDASAQPYTSEINLSRSNLSEVPEMIYTFENMEMIDLSNNRFTIFPYELLKLPNLKVIKLNDNQIRNLDFSAIESSNLEILELQNNRINELEKLENLKNLKTIDLTQNELYQLPNITNESLIFAYLASNRILKLEGKIGKNLIHLNLTFNEIATIDLELTGEETLAILDLRGNYPLKSFPYQALYLRLLKDLNLSNCNISSIAEAPLMINESLEKLYLKDNKLKEFELSSIDLPNLKELDLSDNLLTKVTITNSNLQGLLLGSNKLIHENISLKTRSLSELNLSNNLLSDLPKSSVDAPNLLYLNIFENDITAYEVDKIKGRFVKN